MSKLFIGGLSWNTDENLLRDTFSQHGDVVDCVVIKDRETGKPFFFFMRVCLKGRRALLLRRQKF